MWNPFNKKKKAGNDLSGENTSAAPMPENMGMLQKLAYKKLMNMDEAQRQKLMQDLMKPENIAKHKDQILGMMDNMKASGQLSEEQYQEAKKRLGI